MITARSEKRLLFVLGTRPEAIKLFPLIHACRAQPGLEARVCVTAQHRSLLDQILALADIVPDHDLDIMRDGQSLDALTARLLTGIGQVIDREAPDWVVVQGDTSTAMAGALAAHYRRVRIAHVEAGLRSRNLDHPWPEEANRRIISALATLHFAPTATARDALCAENISAASVHVTGNTGVDALRLVHEQLLARGAPPEDAAALLERFAGRRLVLATLHRRESLNGAMAGIARALARLTDDPAIAVVLPVHPNPAVAAMIRPALDMLDSVALVPPLDYPDFVALLSRAALVITDSGGVQEEAPALGVPVLLVRETTERPEGVAAGLCTIAGRDEAVIVREATRLLASGGDRPAPASPYGDGYSAQRIAALLAAA